jgi:hypothetical protein
LSGTGAAAVEYSSRSRSRLRNRPFTLPGVDGNSAEGRYYRDLCLDYACEIGDPTRLSEADATLVRTAAGLAVEAARLQARVVRNEAVDHEQLVRVSNTLTRTLANIRRKSKTAAPTGPSLADYLRTKAEAGPS